MTVAATMKLDLKPVAKLPSVQAASKLERSMRVGKREAADEVGLPVQRQEEDREHG